MAEQVATLMAEEVDSATAVLEALRLYREADIAMNERVRSATSMSENEMRIVQFLLTAPPEQHAVTPTTLSRHLGVTSASMTALLDRLERAGAIERVRHPSDRRSLLIRPTPLVERTVGAPLVAFDESMREVVSDLTASETQAVLSFLDKLTAAADAASHTGPRR